MNSSRWNDDLPTWIKERHYTKDEVDEKLKYGSLSSIMIISVVVTSFVLDEGVTIPTSSIDEFMEDFKDWCDDNDIDLESLLD